MKEILEQIVYKYGDYDHQHGLQRLDYKSCAVICNNFNKRDYNVQIYDLRHVDDDKWYDEDNNLRPFKDVAKDCENQSIGKVIRLKIESDQLVAVIEYNKEMLSRFEKGLRLSPTLHMIENDDVYYPDTLLSLSTTYDPNIPLSGTIC